jgi:hypothetical protein
MKKIAILLFSILVLTPTLSAQRRMTNQEKRAWLDFQLVQHIGLSPWNDMGYAAAGLPPTSVTELRGVFNFTLFEAIFNKPVLHGFVDMGVGVMPAAEMKTFDLARMPMPNSGTQYYLREQLSESGTGAADAHFRMTTGFSVDIPASEKLTVVPALGVGFLTMPRRSYEMILKEQGTNMQYRTTYTWGGRYTGRHGDDYYYGDYGSTHPGFLTARLNFRYKLRSASSLLLGVEYTRFFDTLDFNAHYTNTFNNNIQRSIATEGNRVGMLALSVGISFR